MRFRENIDLIHYCISEYINVLGVDGVGAVVAKTKKEQHYQKGNERYLKDDSYLLHLSRNSLLLASTEEAVLRAVPRGRREQGLSSH